MLIVGGGLLEKKLKDECKNLDIEKDVIFTGMVNDISDYLQVMDIFVFPSLYEGFGMALLEAQASGLYCLASDKVPKQTFISNNTISLRLDKAPQYWAKYILDYIKSNPHNRKNMSVEACNMINNNGFNINNAAKYLRSIYE